MSIYVRWTIFFESHNEEGWSEGMYVQAPDVITSAASLATLLPLRAAMLDINSSIIYARASDVAVKGDSAVPNVAFPIQGLYAASGATPLEANTCLLVQLFATALIKNRIFLRGLRSNVVIGRDYQAPSDFAGYLSTWKSQLIGDTVQARHRTSIGPPPTYSFTPVTTIQVVGTTARKPGRPFGQPRGRR